LLIYLPKNGEFRKTERLEAEGEEEDDEERVVEVINVRVTYK
jgi:hypothetical protein